MSDLVSLRYASVAYLAGFGLGVVIVEWSLWAILLVPFVGYVVAAVFAQRPTR